MLIKLDVFGGIAPKIPAARLPGTMAQKAVNVRFERPVLESFRGLQNVSGSPPANSKTIFRYKSSSGNAWMSSPSPDARFAMATLVSDPWDYMLFAAPDYPRITRSDYATNGGPPYPSTSYRLGVPQPPAPISLSVGRRTDNGEEVNLDPDFDTRASVSYRISFVDGFGREGPLSDPSEIVSYYPEKEFITVGLRSISTWPSAPPSGTFVTGAKVRIYRSIDGTFRFVGEVFATASTFVDQVFDDSAGLPAETDGWFGPPDDDSSVNPGGTLRNLAPMPGGFFVGSSGFELCASVPDAPHAWPYRLPLADPITGIVSTGNAAVVATTGPTYVVQGVDPAALNPTQINTNQSCVSARSMVNVNGAVIYASPDGLVGVIGYDAQLLTEELVTKEEWQAIFKPQEIHAYYYEGKYIFFNDTKGWIFKPGKGQNSLSELSFVATAGYADLQDDSLYLMVGGQLRKFDSHSTRMDYEWQSKLFRLDTPTNFSYLQVLADSYPVTVEFTFTKMNGATATVSRTVNSIEPVYMPGGYTYNQMVARAQGTTPIKTIALAHDKSEFDYA